tara:strand:+ start:425 stop:547 length:123 start_codon:yes stop_codon:yes gene_type:complete
MWLLERLQPNLTMIADSKKDNDKGGSKSVIILLSYSVSCL